MSHETSWKTRDFVEALFRHKKKGLALSVVILASGALAVLYFPRKYRSEAKVFLQRGRETVGLDPTATTGQTISLMQSDREDEVQSAMDVLRSRGVLAQVVERLTPELLMGQVDLSAGKDRGEQRRPNVVVAKLSQLAGAALGALRSIDPVPDRERALVELEDHLVIDAERNSTVLVISYAAKSPALAQRVLEEVMQVYRQEHARVYRNEKSSKFFDDQRKLLRTRLKQATECVREAKDKMGLASIEARAQTVEQLYSRVSQSRYAALEDLASTRARIEVLERQLAETPERQVTAKRSVPNEGADMLRDQLYQLQVKKSALESKYSESHPLVQAIAEQAKDAERIVQAEATMREETTDDVNPARREMLLKYKAERSVLAGLEASLKVLTEQCQTISQELLALNGAEAEISQLERDLDLANANFLQYAENYEQARIDNELEVAQVSNLSVFQQPTLNYKPTSPSKPLVALTALMLSVVAPIALALLCERFDDRLRRPEDIERALDAPVLTTLYAQSPEALSPS